MDSETMIRFIYLGNLLIEKGPLILLEACRVLKERNIPFSCDIVGAPTAEICLADMQARVREYKLSEHIVLHGARYDEAKEQILSLADVMVFPTFYHNECFPLVLLEGMKHGLALISTNEGAIPDIIIHGRTGLLVKKQDAESLADAMEHLATCPDFAAQLATSAKLHYEDNFSAPRFISRMFDILR